MKQRNQLVSTGINWYQLVSTGIKWYQLVSTGINWYQLKSTGIIQMEDVINIYQAF
jgi:hypothetical protein